MWGWPVSWRRECRGTSRPTTGVGNSIPAPIVELEEAAGVVAHVQRELRLHTLYEQVSANVPQRRDRPLKQECPFYDVKQPPLLKLASVQGGPRCPYGSPQQKQKRGI